MSFYKLTSKVLINMHDSALFFAKTFTFLSGKPCSLSQYAIFQLYSIFQRKIVRCYFFLECDKWENSSKQKATKFYEKKSNILFGKHEIAHKFSNFETKKKKKNCSKLLAHADTDPDFE